MKSEKEIVDRIIELSRKIGVVEKKKNDLSNFPLEDNEEVIKDRNDALLDLDFEINSLGSELNALKWIFDEK